MTFSKKRSGFTLIELLVVIAILATIAGGILVSYDGLETDAAQAQATFNISAVDRAVRTYKTLNKVYPDQLDSLCFSLLGNGTDSTGLNILTSKVRAEKLGPYTLTANGVKALDAVGIRNLRFVSGASGIAYNNATGGTGTSPSIPNRVFDTYDRGFGVNVPLTAGVIVSAIESSAGASGGVTTFTGVRSGHSKRLRDIAGLPDNVAHAVVAFGLGNNSTMVAETSQPGTFGGLSEAPYYTNVAKGEYGRFFLLFHLGSDSDASGSVEDDEIFSAAKFIAVLDTKGDWLDEEYAEFTNQKQ